MKHLVAAAGAALVVAAATSRSLAAPEEIPLDVVFLPSGGCEVAAGAGDPTFEPGVVPSDDSFACRLPVLPAKTPVRLTVTLPAGSRPGESTFPRLTWHAQSGVWRGRATLPSSPTLVKVPIEGGAADRGGRLLDVATLAGAILAVAWTLVRGKQS